MSLQTFISGNGYSARQRGQLVRRLWPLQPARAGVVLLIVLIVVAMLALGAYSFSRLMIVEARGAQSYGRQVQAREAADSGLHYVAAYLAAQKLEGALGAGLFDSPSLFLAQGVTDESDPQPRMRCRFSVVAPNEDVQGGLRYGVTDECARINLNAILQWQEASESGGGAAAAGGPANATSTGGMANPLLYLPNMTSEIADAILDYLDPDDDTRPNGAESDYYLALDPPYSAKNGAINSLDELLLVRGVTPRLLYGEDANRNGLLDANEDDGELSYPIDDSNGTLDRGWLPFLTLYSRESNTDTFNEPRINLNNTELETLYDQLAQDPDFGEEAARFIVAFRLFGPAGADDRSGEDSQSSRLDSGAVPADSAPRRWALGSPGKLRSWLPYAVALTALPQAAGPGSGRGGSGGGPGGSSAAGRPGGASSGSGSQGPSTGSEPGSGPSNGGSNQTGSSNRSSGNGDKVIIAGMDASQGPQHEIESVVDLIDAAVNARIDGQEETTRLESPYQSDAMGEYIDLLLDRTTTEEVTETWGRINVNAAPFEVLMVLPGMTEELADSIVAGQPLQRGSTSDLPSSSLGWLLSSETMTPEEFKQIERYATGRSQVFRVQVVGHYEEGGPMARVEAVIDVSGESPRIRWWHDLTPLGRGFDPQRLMGLEGL